MGSVKAGTIIKKALINSLAGDKKRVERGDKPLSTLCREVLTKRYIDLTQRGKIV